ncbi:hypothetical protein [Corynebacterium tapiri]|uniref:Uncharacterized protein n=1 Tax=Corynebacterium tapiri TaxID=1448266 RepID=A0A5C4U1Q6_9CORY|nr:hypothetical protein [Corynebacterium tapiri]TNL94359.1 hypothetical protein FHE74_10445 [Corynebacterium tapiri]
MSLHGPNSNGAYDRYAMLSPRKPISGYSEVNMSNPGPDWTSEGPIETPTDPDEPLSGSSGSPRADVKAASVSAKLSEIRALKEGEILIGKPASEDFESTRKIVTKAEFTQCD